MTYQLNEHKVCINPTKQVIYSDKKLHCEISYACHNNLWAAGYIFDVKGSGDNCGGSSGPCCFNEYRKPYETKEAAVTSVINYGMEFFEYKATQIVSQRPAIKNIIELLKAELINQVPAKVNQPFKTYFGGKSGNGTYQQIINHIPKIDVFIDCMVGNGGIVSKLRLPGLTVINDIDRSVIDKYDVTGHGKKIIKENQDYSGIIDKYGDASRKILFYFDPPYLMSSRKSEKKVYRFEWDEAKHLEFLERSITVKNNCMISHYPCELYDEYLKGWYTHDFKSMTRAGLRTERIYMNYPKPLVLQDFSYIGTDFRERQRIKRKISRFISKLDGLPADEKTAILSAVICNYDDAAALILNP